MPEQRDGVRVAVIGAGPAGLYAADALINSERLAGISVDIMDRLPTPFGLVRYGVAPDHLSIRSVRDTLDRILDAPGVRFIGGVNVDDGTRGVTIDTLSRSYDAIFLCYGASTDRALGIPGEDLPGSISATEFVRWYTGHPDCPPGQFTDLLARSRRVAVIGVGNVAVDVTRILAKTRAELEHTDMPEHVLAALDNSSIQDIHLMGRRGPAEAAWTTKELRELGELAECSVRVDPLDVVLGPSSSALIATNKVSARNTAVVDEWSKATPIQRERTIQLHFYTKPIRIEGDDSGVKAIVVERTRLTEDGRVMGTGEIETLPVDLVIRSVGYRGVELPGIPFDSDRGVIPNDAGRVLREGHTLPGVYAAGWIKRGPSGIIGTNKKDAVETVNSFLDDLDAGKLPRRQTDDDFVEQVKFPIVDTSGWRRIDEAEKELGARFSRTRTTIHDGELALKIASASD